MALLDFLKRKKEVEKASTVAKAMVDKKQPEKKAEKVSVEKKDKKVEKKTEAKIEKKTETAPKAPVAKGKASKDFSYEAIRHPHISEKASYLSEQNQYVFEVSPNYNKIELKKAVEGVYGVNVLSVNIIKIPPKKRRLGKTEGFKKSYVKAIVKVKEGQKIEIL